MSTKEVSRVCPATGASPRKDRQRVQMAKHLYSLTARVFRFATNNGTPTTVENPSGKFVLEDSVDCTIATIATSSYSRVSSLYGSSRCKQTMLFANFADIASLKRECNNAHSHEPWRRVRNQWATSLEVEYPHGLCVEWANGFIQLMLDAGAVNLDDSLVALALLTDGRTARTCPNSVKQNKRGLLPCR